jgi:chromosome segregation ATPase
MRSSFNEPLNSENGGRREAYLTRLHEIFNDSDWVPWPATEEGQRMPGPASNTSSAYAEERVSEDRTMSGAKQVILEPAETASSETLEQVAQQIAAKFTEAFVSAFREMGMERGETQALRFALSEISERVDRLSDELAGQPRELESVVSRLTTIDERLSEQERREAGRHNSLGALAQAVKAQAQATAETMEASHKLQETQETVQQRLDVQADAIRSVYSNSEDRDDRLREFQVALERAKEVFVSLGSSAKPLPEGL